MAILMRLLCKLPARLCGWSLRPAARPVWDAHPPQSFLTKSKPMDLVLSDISEPRILRMPCLAGPNRHASAEWLRLVWDWPFVG